MGVALQDIADVIATTLDDLPKGEFEVMWDSQNYEFCQIYQAHRRSIDGGKALTRNVMLDQTGAARYTPLYATDTPQVDNSQKQITVPWCNITTNYSWDEVEILANKNDAKGFIDLIKSRRTERMWGLAELIETRGWLTPSAFGDSLYPYGVPYYINFLNDGVTTGGFAGQTIRYQGGTTGTVCAGLDAAVEPKWRNYADIYTKVDNALLRAMRSAVRRTRFRPAPFAIKPGNDKVGSMIKIYANEVTTGELEDLSDKRDDNNTPDDLAGKMLHSFDGVAHFNKMPIVYVPQLDGLTVTGASATVNTPDPIYCIDWSKFQPVVLGDRWMQESKPITDRSQHTTLTVFLDGTHQNLCINRRTAGWVIHKAITA